MDGSNDYIDVTGLSTALNTLPELTMSFWIKSDSIGSDRPFFGLASPSNSDNGGARYDDAAFVGTGNDVMKFSLGISGSNYSYESAENVQTTSWQHVVLVWEDGVGFSAYIDNALDVPVANQFSPVTTGLISSQSEFLIGNGPKGPSASWDGRIDEVAVWESALSSDNVEWLFANSVSNIPEPSSAVLILVGCFVGMGIVRKKA